MKRNEFKNFIDYVSSVEDEKDPIFWCGYYWINLTEKQLANVVNVLKDKSFIKLDYNFRNEYGVVLPSGIHIAFPVYL